MSRVGKSPITLPGNVSIDVSKGNMVKIKGPKGELAQQVDPDIELAVEQGEIVLKRPTESQRHRAMHGLYRALINNMVEGVSKGFVKELELVGVGFRANSQGNVLELLIGYSHPIWFYLPDEVKLSTVSEKGKNPIIRLESNDKQLLGQIAAKIRAFRKPEPYKGKGIRFVGEQIRRKAGKSAGKGAKK